MSEVVRVLFDGKVLLPEKPLKLIPHQTYTIIIESDKKENNEMLDWSRFNVFEKNDGLFFIMKRVSHQWLPFINPIK
jgi:hypothetical protein